MEQYKMLCEYVLDAPHIKNSLTKLDLLARSLLNLEGISNVTISEIAYYGKDIIGNYVRLEGASIKFILIFPDTDDVGFAIDNILSQSKMEQISYTKIKLLDSN